jgi:hypothetical protein
LGKSLVGQDGDQKKCKKFGEGCVVHNVVHIFKGIK